VLSGQGGPRWARPLLLTACAKDLRFALPNARVMIHQPSAGSRPCQPPSRAAPPRNPEPEEARNEIYVKHNRSTNQKIEDAL